MAPPAPIRKRTEIGAMSGMIMSRVLVYRGSERSLLGGVVAGRTELRDAEVLRELSYRRLALTGNRHNVIAELSWVGLGMGSILPAEPTGPTDQLSPTRAAVPPSGDFDELAPKDD